jgi:hypothetical protein
MSTLGDVLYFLETTDSETLVEVSDEIGRIWREKGRVPAETPLPTTTHHTRPGDRH